MTEWDVQIENGVLLRMDDTRSTSYSFWPSSEIKKDVDLKFFQRTQTNYALRCAHSAEYNLTALKEKHNIIEMAQGTSIGPLLDLLDSYALAGLFVTVMAPPLSGAFTVGVTPATFITMTILWNNFVDHIDAAEPDLQKIKEALMIPKDFSDCFEDVKLD